MSVTRRDALLLLGAGAGVSLLGSCSFGGGSEPEPLPGPTKLAPTGTSAEGRYTQLLPGTLRDRVGVNVHWNYYDTPYGRYADVKPLLAASGIRHVRGQTLNADDLAQSGILTTLVVDKDANGNGAPATIIGQAQSLIRSGAIDAVEGPNEPDLFWAGRNWTYQGKSFPDGALAWQRDLYTAVKGGNISSRIPVISMSMGKTYWGGGFPYQKGELGSSCDFGNFHVYAGGNPFADRFSYGGISEYYANADFPSVALDRFPISFRTYEPPYGKRMIASECGYSTWYLGQSEAVQAMYTARLILEYARLGLRRSYIYELIDIFPDPEKQDRDSHFGLLRNDLSPKPAYTAVKSLLGAVGDGIPYPASVPNVQGFIYEVRVDPPSGYDASTLHYLAFAMPDGSTSMAVWNEVTADDLHNFRTTPQSPITQVSFPPMTVQVQVTARSQPRTQLPSANRLGYDGTWETLSIDRSADSATLPVDGRVVLLRF